MSIDTREDRERRVRALLRAVAAVAPTPAACASWLHAPHEALGGLAPSAAAWESSDLAYVAALVLLSDCVQWKHRWQPSWGSAILCDSVRRIGPSGR